jgi:hypothetical protein
MLLVAAASTLAMLAFAALTMNWMRVRMKPWEWLAAAAAVVFLFRPDFFMDQISPEYKSVPATQAYAVAGQLPADERLIAVIAGTTIEGKALTKTVAVRLGEADPDGRKRLALAGLTLSTLGDEVQVMGTKFGGAARKSGFEEGFTIGEIKVASGRTSPYWFYVPGLVLLWLVWMAQSRRMAQPDMTPSACRSRRPA